MHLRGLVITVTIKAYLCSHTLSLTVLHRVQCCHYVDLLLNKFQFNCMSYRFLGCLESTIHFLVKIWEAHLHRFWVLTYQSVRASVNKIISSSQWLTTRILYIKTANPRPTSFCPCTAALIIIRTGKCRIWKCKTTQEKRRTFEVRYTNSCRACNLDRQGFPLFSALRIASPDTTILLIVITKKKILIPFNIESIWWCCMMFLV